MSDYLSVKEASVFTGKSERSIRRLAVKMTGQKHPSSGRNADIVRLDQTPQGKPKYLILKAYLTNSTANPSATQSNTAGHVSVKMSGSAPLLNTDSGEVDALKETIRILREQLGRKDEQISKVSNQLSDVIETNKEYQLILDKVNDALIRMKIPDMVSAQMIPYTEEAKEEVKQEPINEVVDTPDSEPREEIVLEEKEPLISKALDDHRKDVFKGTSEKSSTKQSFTDYLRNLK